MPRTRKVKRVEAGQLVKITTYTQVFPQDQPEHRAAKAKATSAARQRINDKFSYEKLEERLYANFTSADYVVTLTYDEQHQLTKWKYIRAAMANFLKRLRYDRGKRGEALRYIYVTEGLHGDKRVHHHMVINAPGAGVDILEEIKACWREGAVTKAERLDMLSLGALSKYLTKENVENGRAFKGSRSWIASRNLKVPKVTYEFNDIAKVPFAPPGAHVIASESMKTENGFGSYTYLKYILAEDHPQANT